MHNFGAVPDCAPHSVGAGHVERRPEGRPLLAARARATGTTRCSIPATTTTTAPGRPAVTSPRVRSGRSRRTRALIRDAVPRPGRHGRVSPRGGVSDEPTEYSIWSSLPSKRCQASTILPPVRTATAGFAASTPNAERVDTAHAAPPAGSLRTWTRWATPSQRDHAIAAVPPVSIASSGSEALPPSAECVSTASRTPPAGSLADWIRQSSPSQRCHANIAFPVPSMPARAWMRPRRRPTATGAPGQARGEIDEARDAVALAVPAGPGERDVAGLVDRDVGLFCGGPEDGEGLTRVERAVLPQRPRVISASAVS